MTATTIDRLISAFVRLSDAQIESLTDAADAAAISEQRERLERRFLEGMKAASTAASTARLPITVRYNVSDDGEADCWRHVVRLEPVTVIANDLLEAKGGADDHLHLLLADPESIFAMREAQLQALATEYAGKHAESLVAAGWSDERWSAEQ